MNQVDDSPHFVLELTLPGGVLEIMTGRQLRPNTVEEP
jgi:hypothetical protein